VPVLGIEGSALATFVAYVLRWVVLAAAGNRVVRLPMLPLRFVLSVLGVIAAAFALVALPDAGPLIALRVVLGAVALAAFLAMARSIVAPERFAWGPRARAWSGLPPSGGVGAAARPPMAESVADAAVGSV
jgi:hypothetical protein